MFTWNLFCFCELSKNRKLLIPAKVKNKRPRGLDALLGHLLVKTTPVTYQPSSTKIPKYFHGKSKVDTRSSKTGNSLNDPKCELEYLRVKSTQYTLNTYP